METTTKDAYAEGWATGIKLHPSIGPTLRKGWASIARKSAREDPSKADFWNGYADALEAPPIPAQRYRGRWYVKVGSQWVTVDGLPAGASIKNVEERFYPRDVKEENGIKGPFHFLHSDDFKTDRNGCVTCREA